MSTERAPATRPLSPVISRSVRVKERGGLVRVVADTGRLLSGWWREVSERDGRSRSSVVLRGLADDSIGAAETEDADGHVLRQCHSDASRPPPSTETISPTTTWTSVATRPEVVGFSHRLMPVSIERPTDQRPGPFLLSWWPDA